MKAASASVGVTGEARGVPGLFGLSQPFTTWVNSALHWSQVQFQVFGLHNRRYHVPGFFFFACPCQAIQRLKKRFAALMLRLLEQHSRSGCFRWHSHSNSFIHSLQVTIKTNLSFQARLKPLWFAIKGQVVHQHWIQTFNISLDPLCTYVQHSQAFFAQKRQHKRSAQHSCYHHRVGICCK